MSDEPQLSPSAQRVQDALRARGCAASVIELPESTRSAAEAAVAIGCEVAEIAKSMVFRREGDGVPVLVILGGLRRVDERKVAGLVGGKVGRPDAEYVRARVGFAIGGVPPVGHSEAVVTFVDAELMGYGVVWAAAGTPHAVFQTTPAELVALTRGTVADVGR